MNRAERRRLLSDKVSSDRGVDPKDMQGTIVVASQFYRRHLEAAKH